MVDCALRMVINTGWSLEAVLDLDHETFDELFESVLRLEYLDKTERAWTMMVAAQGRHENMKQWVAGWTGLTKPGTKGAGKENQLNDFLKLFGDGL